MLSALIVSSMLTTFPSNHHFKHTDPAPFVLLGSGLEINSLAPFEREMQEWARLLRKWIGYLTEIIGTSPPIERAWLETQALLRRLGAISLKMPVNSEKSDSAPPSRSQTIPPSSTVHSPLLPEPVTPLGGHLRTPNSEVPAYTSEQIRELGRGAYGIVYLVTLSDGSKFVIKEMNVAGLACQMTGRSCVPPALEQIVIHLLKAEIKALQATGSLIGSTLTEDTLTIAMPYVEGRRLSDFSGDLDETVSRSVIRQILTVIETYHRRGIAHSDIKPENIMMSDDVQITLIDLGGARFFSPENRILPHGKLFPGTRGYYDHLEMDVVKRDIAAAGRTLRAILRRPLSQDVQAFIERCLRGEPISELLQDPWLVGL